MIDIIRLILIVNIDIKSMADKLVDLSCQTIKKRCSKIFELRNDYVFRYYYFLEGKNEKFNKLDFLQPPSTIFYDRDIEYVSQVLPISFCIKTVERMNNNTLDQRGKILFYSRQGET